MTAIVTPANEVRFQIIARGQVEDAAVGFSHSNVVKLVPTAVEGLQDAVVRGKPAPGKDRVVS